MYLSEDEISSFQTELSCEHNKTYIIFLKQEKMPVKKESLESLNAS